MGDSREEIEARERYLMKHWREPDKQLAATLGVHISTVQRIRRRLGLHKREGMAKTHYERADRNYGYPYKEMAAEFAKLCGHDQKVMDYFVRRSLRSRKEFADRSDS